MKIQRLIDDQRNFFHKGATLDVHFRLTQLQKLKKIIYDNEKDICEALKKDLGRPHEESFILEFIPTLEDLNFIIKNLKSWTKPQRVPTPFPSHFPGKSSFYYEPYGVTLLISPWNYPFFLTMSPLIGAISAGNCAIVKPSEVAAHTQDIMLKLINENFPPEYISGINALPEEMNTVLEKRYDYIFYTGGTQVGKIIMSAAAKQLTPVTLELGGKSPCIVDETANIPFAARRIAWSKFTNAGQTCIAPDYLYVHESIKEEFIKQLQSEIQKFYKNPATSPDYDRIINKKHFDRLSRLLQQGRILLGGESDANNLYIAPTLITDVDWHDPIMQEEIFGPLLPILTFDTFEDVIESIHEQGKPLALYLFTRNKEIEDAVIKRVSFGGGCINDCLFHVANPNLPFGGVGLSGLGAYHGRYSFETFSHRKSVFIRRPMIDFRFQYPPFTPSKSRWLRRLLRL